jgi:hypothetical protein
MRGENILIFGYLKNYATLDEILPKTSDLSVGTSPVIMVKWLANLP